MSLSKPTTDQQQQKSASYVVLGDRDEICTKTKPNSVFGQLVQHLVCNIRQYQDPTRSPEEWRKQVVLSKYDTCSDDPLNTSSAPTYSMAFGRQSFVTLVKTMNAYVKCLTNSVDYYNDGFEMALAPKKLAINMEKIFQQHGLLVNHSIPLQLNDIEQNRALKNPLRNGVPLPAPTARGDLFWTQLCTFFHPQTKEQCSDEMYGRLVRTHRWGKPNTKPIQWWGVECTVHRWSTTQGNLFQPSQNLSFTPNETLSVLTYITAPYTYEGASNCLKEEWASLLHELVNSLTTSTSDNANETITKRTHLTEDDDCTSFTHTLPLEYDDMPELVNKDFGKSIPKTPPSQIHRKHVAEGGKGHPPNAPLRKGKSSASRVSKGRAATAARIVKLPPPPLVHVDDNGDFYEDSQDPDAIIPSATPKKRKRQDSSTPPPTQPASKKKRRGQTPPPATLPLDINDGFYDNTDATPPLSDLEEEDDNNDDKDSYTIVENPNGTDGIHETKDGEDDELFGDDEDERIEPSQAPPQKDQIIT